MPAYILAASRPWYDQSARRLAHRTGLVFEAVNAPAALTAEMLDRVKPDFIFFPHWSWIIDDVILSKFKCVIFHMTDLPYGRGGSPLQNLIVRGHTETMISALKCVSELDAGPIYLKKPLSLDGTAHDIFLRSVPIVEDMIVEIISKKLEPQPQIGPVTVFPRRQPEEGDISVLRDLTAVYNHIRMLDAPGYPPAFLKIGPLKFEFKQASLKDGRLKAVVAITEEKA